MFCIHSGFLIRKIAPKTNNIQQMEAKANQLGWMSQFSNLFFKKNMKVLITVKYMKKQSCRKSIFKEILNNNI